LEKGSATGQRNATSNQTVPPGVIMEMGQWMLLWTWFLALRRFKGSFLCPHSSAITDRCDGLDFGVTQVDLLQGGKHLPVQIIDQRHWPEQRYQQPASSAGSHHG